jgi:pyrroloquinoline quinone (PQQ) biosynthesis protein C
MRRTISGERRRSHRGGDGNHRFEGERYLNAIPKEVRRKQLRKLVDEGGQTSVGGPMPSHPTLSKWHSYEFGLSDEEITRLEKEDPSPESLITTGWWHWLQRTGHWAVAIGSSLVGEGSKRLPGAQEYYARQIDETREQYQEMGIKNVDRAVQLMIEHAPFGVDLEHARFGEAVVKEFVDTPELQEEMRQAFFLTLCRNWAGQVI